MLHRIKGKFMMRMIALAAILLVVAGIFAFRISSTVLARSPSPAMRFGVELVTTSNSAQKAHEAHASFVRYNAVRWAAVESVQGIYNWSALADFEQKLQLFESNNLTVIVIVRGTPSWAQEIAGRDCGPIKPANYGDFANFLNALVSRYNNRVSYWEIWNEPDAPDNMTPPWPEPDRYPYGCWAKENDRSGTLARGTAFGNMLKTVYPAIKQANPNAQVLTGGLMSSAVGSDAAGSGIDTTFLEGILQAGRIQGGTYNGSYPFDIVPYHGYVPWYPETEATIDWDINYRINPNWGVYTSRGGFMLAKLNEIRSILGKYGAADKQLMMNEGALLCREDWGYVCPSAGFENAKANYVIRLYTRGWSNGLSSTIWFTFNDGGWHNSGLLNNIENPLPAYNALKFLAGFLEGATYNGQLAGKNDPFEGYRFCNENREYRIYWTNNALTTAVLPPIPGSNIIKYDKVGNIISSNTISFEPMLIQSDLAVSCDARQIGNNIDAVYYDSAGGYTVIKGDRYWYRANPTANWYSNTLYSAYYSSPNAAAVGIPTTGIDAVYYDSAGGYTVIKGDRYWYRANPTANWYTNTVYSAYYQSTNNAVAVGVPTTGIDAVYYDSAGGYTVIKGDRYWYRANPTANWYTNTLFSAYYNSTGPGR